MKPEHEYEIQPSNHWLDRALANCFMACFLALAVVDGWLNCLCRKLKGRK